MISPAKKFMFSLLLISWSICLCTGYLRENSAHIWTKLCRGV